MPETLEQAREMILTLNEQIAALTTERDNLSQDNNTLTESVNTLREMNQRFFNRLIAQENTPETEESDQVETCEEYAAKLNI